MKVALLHDTFWPEIGGVEQVMRDQANMLAAAGHEVTVLAGQGTDPDAGRYEVRILPELALDFPLHAQVSTLLERGQVDQNFSRYRSLLVEALNETLRENEVTLVHDIFTTHRNLALTRALHDLAPHHRLIAWTHDLVAGNPDYALPNPTQPPWNLMRMSVPHVTYIAVSDLRAGDLQAQLKAAPAPHVIPNPLDPIRLFNLTPEMRESFPSLELAARDFIFLLPSPIIPRKNIDYAIQVVTRLREMEYNPLLILTAPPTSPHAAPDPYGDFLRQSLPDVAQGHVVFVNDFFPVHDDTLRDLYLLADCLLLPSRREGFGLPVIEAAAYRLPIWCQDIPAYQALAEDGAAYPLEDIFRLPEAIEWLESLPTFRQQRRCRQAFDPSIIYRTYYEPLLASIVPDASAAGQNPP